MESLILAIVAGGVALLFAGGTAIRVMRADAGNQRMRDIGDAIREGSGAFLRREYLVLLPFVIIVAGVLWGLIDWWTRDDLLPRTAISYLAGTLCSATAGFIGMQVAVRANTRTAAAAMRGLNPALRVAFSSGSVMGITVVGIGLLGVTILYVIFKDISVVAGFGFGASSIALFARVGGGIFTKAADVGTDLVGKVEAGIPEDDPRNPGVIADNVGDNVGDVAGMGADLFESYVSSIIATIALAVAATTLVGSSVVPEVGWKDNQAVLPLLLAAAGILASIMGTFIVRAGEEADFGQLLWALRRGIFAAAVFLAIFAVIIVLVMDLRLEWLWAILTGLSAGIIIGLSTEYYTSYDYGPVREVAANTQTGAATVMISGLATGMISTVIPLLAVGLTIIIAFGFADFYGVALAGVGLLSTLGITLATDAYGPVADNAGGIAEQAQLAPEVRQRTDALDALGNTTAATGKGFAIGSAALTSLALLAAYAIAAKISVPGIDVVLAPGEKLTSTSINLLDYKTLVGLLLGAMLPFLFSAFTMKAVGRAAFAIVEEVRRQFREIPGIMDGTGRPDYARCVDISTRGALKEMVVPGLMAVIVPIAAGFILGPVALGGLLIGAVGSGFMLAIMMATAGGAWDNAKKYVELGNYGGKGSDAHKAAVEGDVVGDPFKDTSGPSLNILLKLMAIVSLVFAPVFLKVEPVLDRIISP